MPFTPYHFGPALVQTTLAGVGPRADGLERALASARRGRPAFGGQCEARGRPARRRRCIGSMAREEDVHKRRIAFD